MNILILMITESGVSQVVDKIDLIDIAAKGGGFVVLSVCFAWVLKYVMTTIKDAIDALKDTINLQTKAINVLSISVTRQAKELLAHDLTVTGLNPSTGANIDERTNKAYLKYTQAQKRNDEILETISKGI